MPEKWIFDDVGMEHNDIVGKKCANLGEMRRAGIPVPAGFALSLAAYEAFMKETNAFKEICKYLESFRGDPHNPAETPKFDMASNILRGIVESKKMPDHMEGKIRKYYEDLCKKANTSSAPVATRSSGPASHPGQYETFLHIKGASEVMKNIIKVWASTFNPRSLIARARLKLPLETDPIGVAVLAMVDAKAAGVMFTLNPVNGDTSKISIGGNWGLGESVVSGEVTNDQWMLDKVTFEIIERRIAKKTIECVLDTVTGKVVNRAIPQNRQAEPCLSNEELLELAEQAKRIEQYFGVPQDIEWSIDKRLPFPKNVFFVQARPETIWSKKETKSILETKKEFGVYDIFSLVQDD